MVEYVKKWNLEKLKKYRYPALILALGLMLLLLPVGGRADEPQETVVKAQSGDFSLALFTEEAETLLSQVQGAGEVRLLLSLETDGRRDYLSDERQSQGAESQQTERQAVLTSGSGSQEPVILSRSYPEFRGAVVLCQGADSAQVTLSIKEALGSLTGLGMDKITVLKMN